MAAHTKKISPQLTGILSRLVITRGPMAWVARITDGQLDRKVYVLLNEALEALGGKWHRGVKGHIFAEDPTEAIEELILTGEYKTKFAGDFFQTPTKIAQQMAEWAVRSGDRVLEPSAGHGRIVKAAFAAGAATVDCYEIDPKRVEELTKLRGNTPICEWGHINCADFLTVTPPHESQLFDAIVMNPPFMRGAAALHILHAMRFLKRGGRLATLAPLSLRFREDAAHKELRQIISDDDIETLEPKSFAAEGTNIDILLATWQKP